MQTILLILAIIAVLSVMVYVAFGGNRNAAKRLKSIKARHLSSAESIMESQMKKAIAARKPLVFAAGAEMGRIDRLRLRLERCGKDWTVKQYFFASAAIAVLVTGGIFFKGAPLFVALPMGMLMGLGLPHMTLGFLINKRLNKFTSNFPDAIELLVRGLRSGLPVGETLAVIANEIPGPVGEEFKIVVEKVKIGKTMEDALQDTAERLGTPEFQFFVITLAIQRETGGNLAETLSNLADVLRKRAQMKLKIKAMSSESKASAYIVGSLPFIVFGLVWSVNANYLAGFFTEPRLIIAGIIGLVWMGIGVGIMAKMVNFEI